MRPVVQSLEPAALPAGRAAPVTLRGINLRNGLQLWLGSQRISGLIVDAEATTATFTVPATVPPGAYPLYLAAAGSANTIYAGTLYVGEQLWLPFIDR